MPISMRFSPTHARFCRSKFRYRTYAPRLVATPPSTNLSPASGLSTFLMDGAKLFAKASCMLEFRLGYGFILSAALFASSYFAVVFSFAHVGLIFLYVHFTWPDELFEVVWQPLSTSNYSRKRHTSMKSFCSGIICLLCVVFCD